MKRTVRQIRDKLRADREKTTDTRYKYKGVVFKNNEELFEAVLVEAKQGKRPRKPSTKKTDWKGANLVAGPQLDPAYKAKREAKIAGLKALLTNDNRNDTYQHAIEQIVKRFRDRVSDATDKASEQLALEFDALFNRLLEVTHRVF